MKLFSCSQQRLSDRRTDRRTQNDR